MGILSSRSARGIRPETADGETPPLANGSLKKPPPPKSELGDAEFKKPNAHGCSYCGRSFPDAASLTAHSLDRHADLLFHCDVCGLYLDRKLLISHMSQHAEEQYAEAGEKALAKVETANLETEPVISPHPALPVEDDAFSISSHSDGRFEPIPDSVFEAIRDTDEPNEPSAEPSPKTLERTCEDMREMSEKLSSRNPPATEANRRTCPICSKEFRVASSYHYHVKHFHGGVKDHCCSVCGRSFAVKSALANHLTLHTGEKPYSCPQCGKRFRSKASVYIHYNNVHCDSKKFPCPAPSCERSFRWKQKLLRHMASHTKEKKHFCAECGKGFGVKYDLTRHAKTHLKAKPHACDQCGMTFAQRRYLKKHTEKKHPTPPESREHKQNVTLPSVGKDVVNDDLIEILDLTEDSAVTKVISEQCHKCHRLFSAGPVFEYHMSKCSQDSQYKCTDCDEEFSAFVLYRKHFLGGVACRACSRNICKRVDLNAHLSVCPGPAPGCKKCRMKFKDIKASRQHEKSCSIFACLMCPKRFVSLETLTMHCYSRHNRTCKYCKKTFKNEMDYSNHASAKHSFVCEKCMSHFTTSVKFVESKGVIHCVKCLSLTGMKTVSKIKIRKRKSNANKVIRTKSVNTFLSSISDPPAVKAPACKSNALPAGNTETLDSMCHPDPFQSDKDRQCPFCSKDFRIIVNVKTHLENCQALSLYMKKREALTCEDIYANVGLELMDGKEQISNGEMIPIDLPRMEEEHQEEILKEGIKSSDVFNSPAEDEDIKEDKISHTALEKYEKTVDEIFNGMSTKSPGKDSYHVCELCCKIFSMLRAYKRHMTVTHELGVLFNAPTQYHCDGCRSGKNSLREMNSHLYDRHEIVFRCDHCPVAFVSKAERRAHVVSAHPDAPAHDCRLCPSRFPDRERLNRHLYWHWRVELVDCGVCGKQIKGRKKFASHRGYHRNRVRESEVNLCPECGKSMSTQSGLQAHMRYVHRNGGAATALCPDCGLLTQARFLPRHRVRAHGDGGLFRCHTCSRGFLSKELLRQHMDTHIRGRPHRCDLCPSAFKQLRNLRMHKRNRHSGLAVPGRPSIAEGTAAAERRPRPLAECPVCSLTFSPRRMRAHAATHEPPKPDVSCTRCDKTFTTAGSLSSHVKWVHLGERNFSCSYCPAKFKRRDAQVVHERRHTDERPYGCGVCDRLFRQRTDCKRHEAKHASPGFRCDRRRRDMPLGNQANKVPGGDIEITSGEDRQATAFLSYIIKD